MLNNTWPGMEIDKPIMQMDDDLEQNIVMFCRENRITREIFWAGSGFQIWCQLLTHISKVNSKEVIVLDEPEIFLHPDLQRKLVKILKNKKTRLLLATHSTEIISEADPDDVIVVDKANNGGKRLKNIDGLQDAISFIGSCQNITLTKLANSRKVLFVEGKNDFNLIKRFAKKIGEARLYFESNVTPVESEGFGNWERINGLGWGMVKTLGRKLMVASVFDRDYRSDKEVSDISKRLEKTLEFVHFLNMKEIENYLLHIKVLARALRKQLLKHKKEEVGVDEITDHLKKILDEITEKLKEDVKSQVAAKKTSYMSQIDKGTDTSTHLKKAFDEIETLWPQLNNRLKLVPGKKVLRSLRAKIQESHGVNLTDYQIIDEFSKSEVDEDMLELIQKIKCFSEADVSSF